MSNPRYNNPAADALIDVKHPCLDHGFVVLRDYLGGDKAIVDAARISYQDGTKTVNDDKGLIDHLMRNQHTSPFESVSITFHIKMPIFVARQLIRHRTAKANELSGRYSILPREFYVPREEDLQPQSSTNKQGREEGELKLSPAKIRTTLEGDGDSAFDLYDTLIAAGLARELSRINLPLSTYTEMIWTMDLHNLMKFLRLRLDGHAQYEIRVFAQAIYEITKVIAPLTMASFDNWIKGAVTFSAEEFQALKWMIAYSDISNKSVGTLASFFSSTKALDRFLAKLENGKQQ